VAAAAFLGGLLTTGAVMRFATVHGRPDLSTMLLAGIAVNAVAGAALGLLLVVADDGQLRSITFWTLGSLAGGSWPALAVVGAATLGALGWSIRAAPSLDAMLLGHGEARLLGVEVDRVQRRAVALVALTVGTATAVCGVIGFVGLVVPHLARLLVGPSHRVMLPLSALLGAGLMVGADLLARTVVAPAELPVGLLTTLLGGPFFLGLLARSRGR
jgi:iron complex transport system permease protein